MRLYISFILFFIVATTFAQPNSSPKPPINWQLMDWKQDGYPGISLEKAYNDLLKNKKSLKKIIVAIIDDGSFDTTHPDLIGMEWTNKKETPGNAIDDDKNGFVDDVHGWSFTGDKLNNETFEAIREYVRLRSKFENKTDSNELKKDPRFTYWKRVVSEKEKLMAEWEATGKAYSSVVTDALLLKNYWRKKLKKDTIYLGEVFNRQPGSNADSAVIVAQHKYLMGNSKPAGMDGDTFDSVIVRFRKLMEPSSENLYTANTIIEKNDAGYFRKRDLGDDPDVNTKRNYGNANTTPLRAAYAHGIGCAGIIAALRNNNIGGNGITNAVEIMPIKEFVAGDERDKDVANAILYAVDNGAQVINMSFGKYYSPQKEWVDEAVKYAEKKGVLLICAAGNDATNKDSILSYPNPIYEDKTIASNMIRVGASTYDSSLVAPFSNYGSTTVDVFAPGVAITTTGMNKGFQTRGGTSYAAPMVTGLAAFIWSYYPTLTYKQVRYCIEKSATPIKISVIKPGATEKVTFNSLSRAGGIVNAYNAIYIAEQIVKRK